MKDRFTAALDGLLADIKKDRTVLAAILCGSLAHDVVWERSDIDLMLVTADDRDAQVSGLAVAADSVNVHVNLLRRAEFRKVVNSAIHNSFIHSLLTKGRLLYTTDDTIRELFEKLGDIGASDTELQLLSSATHVLPPLDKAHKWFVTRGDLEYTALWILYAATPLAEIELLSRRRLVGREVIPEAAALNPAFFKVIYADLLNEPKTRERVAQALDAVDTYIAERAPALFAPILQYLREVGEARSAHEIAHHFTRRGSLGDVTTACEYLAYRHLIGRASSPAKLTKRSNVEVQELAFFALGDRG